MTCISFELDRPSFVVDDEVYARALLGYTDGVLRLFIGERLITKVFGRVLQSHAMGWLVIAHFDAVATGLARPTLTWLQAKSGCPRTLAAFVSMAKTLRLIAEERNPQDRRERFLVPGPRIVSGLRDWLDKHLVVAEMLQILPAGCAERLRRDNDYFACFVRASALVLEGMSVRRTRFPLWQWFDDRDCGLRIAYAFLRAHCEACLLHGHPVDHATELALSGAEVARQLGLSKSHVRNVLNGAETLGALTHDPHRRSIRLTPGFLQEARASFVHLLELLAAAHHRSLTLRNDNAVGASQLAF